MIAVLLIANKSTVTIGHMSNEGMVVFNHKSINNVIDFYLDDEGNYYYLDYDDVNTYMYKVSADGMLFFRTKLPSTGSDTRNYYKKILVDQQGNIYVSVTITPQGSRFIAREVIQQYDSRGNYLKTVYEVIPDEPMRMGNPFSAFSGRLINIQFLNDQMFAFDRRTNQEIALLEIDYLNGGNAKELVILNIDTAMLRDIIYTVNGEIYFLNRQAQIHRINPYGMIQRLELSYKGYERVIPYTFSTDQWGDVYFTDVYNNNLVQLSRLSTAPSLFHDLDQIVAQKNNIILSDLRNIKVFDDKLAGHSRIGTEGNNFLATMDGGEWTVVDRVALKPSEAIKSYGIWVLLIILGTYLLIWAYTTFSSRMGLLTKQIFIFMPIFLTVMLSLVLLLANMARDFTINGAYEKVATVAAMTTKLMDGDKFRDLDHPYDDFGPEFREIMQQIRVDRDGIYFVSYFVEDDRIFVGVSTSIQSYTPIEFLYDYATVQSYYNVLYTGEIQLGSTVDSFGEWMFALAPIRDSQGEIVGILEHGLHGGDIKAEINSLERKLSLLMIGIALAVTIVYILMLKYSLRALDILKQSVAEVAAGRWDSKVEIQTKDEFRDIGLAFNKMSDHIQEYIEEITKLNKAYIKFVPQEFFALLGKKNVLDVNLGEQVMEEMTIMYINIRNIDEQVKQMDIKENYAFINRILETMARVVSANKGVIERFQGAGAIALFKNDPEQAIIAALKMMEEVSLLNSGSQKQIDLGITINSGQILVGIVGYENRLSTTIISNELQNTHLLEKLGAKLGISLIVAQSTMNQLPDLKKYQYRYVGRIKELDQAKQIEAYEFLDSYPKEIKDHRLMTKNLLEEGIAFYQKGDLAEARKRFISVIRANRHDDLAKTYLLLCENHINLEISDWDGSLENI